MIARKGCDSFSFLFLLLSLLFSTVAFFLCWRSRETVLTFVLLWDFSQNWKWISSFSQGFSLFFAIFLWKSEKLKRVFWKWMLKTLLKIRCEFWWTRPTSSLSKDAGTGLWTDWCWYLTKIYECLEFYFCTRTDIRYYIRTVSAVENKK